MSKKIEKAIKEKMQVKLPENLNSENILSKLPQEQEKIIEMPKKKTSVKKFIPMVASFAVIIGLLGTYFGLNLGKEKEPETQTSDIIEVVHYSSYDRVYEKFDEFHKQAEKEHYQQVVDGFTAHNTVNEGIAMPEDFPEDVGEDLEDSAVTGSGVNASQSNKDFGITNNQEKGVEEGDIIKTDGNYLYVVNHNNVHGIKRTITIVEIDGKEMKKAAEIDVKDDRIEEIYLKGDTLIVICRRLLENEQNKTFNGFYETATDAIYPYYGSSNTVVKVYDIKNRQKPELTNEYEQQGDYNSSRVIDGTLYAISTLNINVLYDDYRDACIPEFIINGEGEKVPANNISIIEDSTYPAYTIVTAIDIEKNGKPTCEAVLGYCQEIYASTKGLFICEPKTNNTNIYRFEYTDTGVNFKCMGKVKGSIHNQFSMSFDGEYFRVATLLWKEKTSDDGNTVSSSTSNTVTNLYILNEQMQPVGKVEDLAQGEQIKSVRFVGDMAYVVTFRQVDPLFVIDLSDPENPTVKGELKIPGFSQYLHPITEGLLVGVGSNQGDNDRPNDAKVSLFDVSNPYEPKEKSVLYVDGQNKAYCHTQVGYNHKLYINLSETEFAVPFTVSKYVASDTEGIAGGEYYIRYKLSGGELCEVSRYYLDDNFTILGATYVEDTFYVLASEVFKYGDKKNYGAFILAFDMTTNELAGKIQTSEFSSEIVK